MKPSQLLVEAKRLLEHGDRPHAALRLRAATLLARQALEGRADELLRRRVSQLEEARFDARLLLLEEVIRERALARHMRFVRAALSSASICTPTSCRLLWRTWRAGSGRCSACWTAATSTRGRTIKALPPAAGRFAGRFAPR